MSWEAFLGLPSPEHRRHIRRFHRSDLTNEQDVALMTRLRRTGRGTRPRLTMLCCLEEAELRL